MSFCSVYIPVGVPTYHMETAQDQFERSCAMLRSVDPDIVCPDDKLLGNFHGLARALIHNNVVGKKQLTIEGTGFKAALQGKTLALSLGFASPKLFAIPDGITITVENDGLQVTVTGIDKDKVGESAARIRAFYPAEPYKGKGVKYLGEHIRRKQGKKVA